MDKKEKPKNVFNAFLYRLPFFKMIIDQKEEEKRINEIVLEYLKSKGQN